MYCFHSEHQQVEGVQSAHGGSLRCEGIGQIQNWSVILKEENLGFRLNINLSAILKNLSNYAQVYIHICLYLHCIVLFPLRAPASWWSAKCTRRLFKVRRNWPNSKLICYSERGEPMLSFEYELSATLENSLRCERICKIQNWYVILKEENLGFHLNINLSAIFENFSNYTQVYIHINCFLQTVLYCFHWEHQQVERVQSAHGGSLRFEGIGQIQNWCVILKEFNLGFHLNINLSAICEKLSNYTQVYIHIFLYLHCIALFPLRAPASWRSAKCTRRLFKVWRNWPNSKLICYSERGESRLSFEYKFVGHS